MLEAKGFGCTAEAETLHGGRADVIEDHLKTENEHQFRVEQPESSSLITDEAMLQASNTDTLCASKMRKLKGKEIFIPNRDLIDLTSDSPQSDRIRLSSPLNGVAPEMSFLRRHHRSVRRPRGVAAMPHRNIKADADSDVLVVDSQDGQKIEDKDVCLESMSNREAIVHVDNHQKISMPQKGLVGHGKSVNALESVAAPVASSSGRTNIFNSGAGEKKDKMIVSSGIDSHVVGSSAGSGMLLPLKRKTFFRKDPGTGNQRFKPPRRIDDVNLNSPLSGGAQRPIEVDSLDSPSSSASVHNDAPCTADVARQIEEDELLAKFLQEDYTFEADGGNFLSLDDAQLAQILQEEENQRGMRESALITQAASREISRLGAASRSRGRGHVASSSRMRILRNMHNRARQDITRGHGLLRDIVNSEEHMLHFPEGVDLETRLELLAAMESATGDTLGRLGRIDRDFNENDYEMLLALDDSNQSRSGASYNKIEQLPVSVIKPTDVYEETCSICLEIPVVDDVVRRLPCMHAFHLQCIDEWLERQANCPICKVRI